VTHGADGIPPAVLWCSNSWISQAELVAGGTLVFRMGHAPNKQFDAALADRPPSFGQSASAAMHAR
jgi:putative alpha-1,2-mannosidase